MDPLPLRAEQVQQFGRPPSSVSEGVRHPGVELCRFALGQYEVLVVEQALMWRQWTPDLIVFPAHRHVRPGPRVTAAVAINLDLTAAG